MREWAGAISCAILVLTGIVWLNSWLFDFVLPKAWMNYQPVGSASMYVIALLLARVRMNRLNSAR